MPVKCQAPVVEMPAFQATGSCDQSVDASGVPAASIRVVFRDGVIVVAGEKLAYPASSTQTYHLVERDFGRFARVVRVTGAFDVERAAATLGAGQLTVVLPKRLERRGVAHRVAIRTTDGRPA